ncbi:hypothetical protein HDU88_007825 [Geranomyces variabilis]|nr:hypothetical protein HDU88_007825 [Geranomyces variabilis]
MSALTALLALLVAVAAAAALPLVDARPVSSRDFAVAAAAYDYSYRTTVDREAYVALEECFFFYPPKLDSLTGRYVVRVGLDRPSLSLLPGAVRDLSGKLLRIVHEQDSVTADPVEHTTIFTPNTEDDSTVQQHTLDHPLGSPYLFHPSVSQSILSQWVPFANPVRNNMMMVARAGVSADGFGYWESLNVTGYDIHTFVARQVVDHLKLVDKQGLGMTYLQLHGLQLYTDNLNEAIAARMRAAHFTAPDGTHPLNDTDLVHATASLQAAVSILKNITAPLASIASRGSELEAAEGIAQIVHTAAVAGCSSTTVPPCTREVTSQLTQSQLALLESARALDLTGRMFTEGAYPTFPPFDGWIASDIVQGAGEGGPAFDAIFNEVAKLLLESIASPDFANMENLHIYMNRWHDAIESEPINPSTIMAHLNAVQGYNSIHAAMYERGWTRWSAWRPAVERVSPLTPRNPVSNDGGSTFRRSDRRREKRDNDNDDQDPSRLIELVRAAREDFEDERFASGILNNPQPGDLYEGAQTVEDVIDGIGTAILEWSYATYPPGISPNLEARDNPTTGNSSVPLLTGAELARRGAILRKKAKDMSRTARLIGMVTKNEAMDALHQRGAGLAGRVSSNYEALLSFHNAFVGDSGSAIKDGGFDLRSDAQISSVLGVDAFATARDLTGNENILPNGEPLFGSNGEVLAYSLYGGANSEEEAFESMIADARLWVLDKMQGPGNLKRKDKLKLKRIMGNIAKRAQVKQDNLASAVAEGVEVGYQDIDSYEKDVRTLISLDELGVDMADVEGMTIAGETEEGSNGGAESSDTFPSFVDRPRVGVGPGNTRQAKNFRGYGKIVNGARSLLNKVRRFASSARRGASGRLRSSIGTTRGASPSGKSGGKPAGRG